MQVLAAKPERSLQDDLTSLPPANLHCPITSSSKTTGLMDDLSYSKQDKGFFGAISELIGNIIRSVKKFFNFGKKDFAKIPATAIDLHLNGLCDAKAGLNCSFWDSPTDKDILALRKYLFERGVKSFLPTLITDSPESIEKNLKIISEHKAKYDKSEQSSLEKGLAHIPGVHIEGGYISRLGTHPEKYKEALNPSIADQLATKFPELIKIWTLCPLVDKDGKHVEVLKKHKIVPSYGHSEANYQQAMDAFNKYGVRLVTHWGNSMHIFTPDKRTGEIYNREDPSSDDLARLDSQDSGDGGLGKAAYDHPEVYMMAICGSDEDKDYHISPRLIKKLSGTKRLILVTDASSRHAGTISNSGCQKRGYNLSGGQVPLSKHIENARRAGLSDKEIKLATEINPAKILAA